MSIIGISGKVNSGKDEIGNIIRYLTSGAEQCKIPYFDWDVKNPKQQLETHSNAIIDDWKIVKFADALKECVAIMIGCKRSDLENREFKETPLGPEWQTPGSTELLTPRKVMTQLGTELIRKNIHVNTWVNATMSNYIPIKNNFMKDVGKFTFEELLANKANYKYHPNWLITDVRFPNEVQSIKDKNGIVIRVTRQVEFNPVYDELVWINYAGDWYLGNYRGKDVYGNYMVYYKSLELLSKEVLPVNAEPLNLEGPENALNSYTGFDYNIYNDGTIEDLIEKVREILKKEKYLSE
jgi:hypothetical protein